MSEEAKSNDKPDELIGVTIVRANGGGYIATETRTMDVPRGCQITCAFSTPPELREYLESLEWL